MSWKLTVCLFVALEPRASQIWFVAPDERVCAGETRVALETNVKEKDLIGLELFIDGTSQYYADSPPFETYVDFRSFPDGELELKAVLSVFDATDEVAVFQVTNISQYYAEDVAFVRVPVLLRGSCDENLPSLSTADFVLTEDDVQQKICRLMNRDSALNVVVLLDASGSMETALPAVKRGFFAFLDRLRPQDSVKLIGFNEDVFQIWDFETDKQLLKRKILGLRADGDTNLYGAIWAGARAARQASGRRAVLVFTDGHQDFSTPEEPGIDKTLPDCIKMAQDGGIPIYTVGVGGDTRPEILQQIADETGGLCLSLRSKRSIAKAFDDMGRHLGFLFVLGYYTESHRDGWHEIDVRLSGNQQWHLYYPKKLYFESKHR